MAVPIGRLTRLLACAALIAGTMLNSGASSATAATPAPEQPPPATASVGGFSVAGNQIIGPDGKAAVFKGVNAWSFGPGGPSIAGLTLASMDSQIDAMRAWGFNLVRLYLSDNFWLDPSCGTGLGADLPGNLQNWVADAVQRITADGMAAELTLWEGDGAPASNPCEASWSPMADYPDAVNMWTQVAQMFQNNPKVIFELYNEPDLNPAATSPGVGAVPAGENPDSLWLNGGPINCCSGTAAGMQQMYNAIRSTGASNLVFVTGETLGPDGNTADPYDSLKVALRDPVAGYNIVYATHIYDGSFNTTCGDTMLPLSSTPSALATRDDDYAAILPTAAVYPVVLDEFGSSCGYEAGEENNADIVNFADAHHLGYAVFAWGAYYSGPTGIDDNGWGILNDTTNYDPSSLGIPIFDDLRAEPCALYCAGPVFANPPRLQDYEPAVTSVSVPSVALAPSSAAGASGVDYTVDFQTSSAGLLTQGSWIRLAAPPGTNFYPAGTPLIVDLTSGAVVGASCCAQVGAEQYPSLSAAGANTVADDVAFAPASNIITLPLSGNISPGDEVQVELSGVVNPATSESSDTISVSTSTDRAPVASTAYEITAAQPVSGVSESLSNTAAGATGVSYTTTFTTSSTGAMSGLWPGGTVTVSAPTGTDFTGSEGRATLTDLTTGQPVAGGYLTEGPATFTFAVRDPISAGDTLALTLSNVTNPSTVSSSDTISVATSSDTVPASSPAYAITAS